MRVPRLALCALLVCSVSPAWAVGRLADVSIYDREQQRPLPVIEHAGRYYVIGTPRHTYEIVIRNRRGEEILGVVSVDGINVISGQTASPDQSGYVIPGGQRLAIAGWRKNLKRVAAFYFTTLPDSYAARTGRARDVGVIGVALFRPKVEARPLLESQSLTKPGARRRADDTLGAQAPLGTGHGRSERSPAEYVNFERASLHPDEVIEIYYDSHDNLVAAGVLPRPADRPRAFPAAFVPDPPPSR